MTRITKAMKEQFKRYRKAYGNMTDEECLEMWDYDNNWCNSDEDAKSFGKNFTQALIDFLRYYQEIDDNISIESKL